jgi:Fe2+ or Zn2+ uptake regulation protein
MMSMDAPGAVGSDAGRLRARGLRVTGPRLAILAMLQQVGGHRSADELVAALRAGGYHHARTTVYNALDDLARAGLVRAAPVDAGALRYETAAHEHHHFVCRRCGTIINVPMTPDLAGLPIPPVAGARPDEIDVIYRGYCEECAADGVAAERTEAPDAQPKERPRATEPGRSNGGDEDDRRSGIQVGGEQGMQAFGSMSGSPVANRTT